MAERKERVNRRDWDQIKTDFIEGVLDPMSGTLIYPTLEEIGKSYGVSYAVVRQRAAKERWTSQQEMYRKRLEEARRAAKQATLVREAAEFDSKLFTMVKTGLDILHGRLIKSVTAESQPNDQNIKDILSTGRIEVMSRAMKHLQAVGKLALGDASAPIPAEKVNWDEIEETDERLGDVLRALEDAGLVVRRGEDSSS